MDRIGNTNLFIGNSSDARKGGRLAENGIQDIVNVAKDLNDPWLNPFRYYKVGLDDGGNNSMDEYRIAAGILSNLLRAGRTVLLHCHEGRSRTAAVARLYFMINEKYNLSYDDAKLVVETARPLCAKLESAHEEILQAIDRWISRVPIQTVEDILGQ